MMERLLAQLENGKRYVPAFIVAMVVVVYSCTMNRTVSFIDSGELAAVATLLGIGHPTGYPLFSIAGRFVVTIMPVEPILSLNILGLVFVASSVGLFYLVAIELLESLTGEKTSARHILAASGGSLVFAFSTTVWAQSVSVEVYSLHLFLALLFLLFFLKGTRSEPSGFENSRFFILSVFVLGLGFTNHMTTLLLVPTCLYLYVARFGVHRESLIRLLRSFPFFLLGLSLYTYLPIRSASQPPLDWGHPADLERFYWHVSGKQYRSWLFSGFGSAERQLGYFVDNFSSVFSWMAIAVVVVGLWTVLSRSRQISWFVLLMIAVCVGYSINYDIHDIDSYFLLAYVGVGFLFVFGMLTVLDRLQRSARYLMVLPIVILPMFELYSHKEVVDESDNTLVHDYAITALTSLDSNAVVFTYQWDYLVSAAYYLQLVEKIRPDVTIIDKELLRRSWYFIQLRKTAPWLVEKNESTIDLFLMELYKFEHHQPYVGAAIEGRFNTMVNAFIDSSIARGPVYVGAEIEPQFAGGYDRVPEGLLLRLHPPGAVKTLKPFDPLFLKSDFRSRLTTGLKIQYAKMLTLRAIWLLKGEGGTLAARTSLEGALEIEPTYVPALKLLHALPD